MEYYNIILVGLLSALKILKVNLTILSASLFSWWVNNFSLVAENKDRF